HCPLDAAEDPVEAAVRIEEPAGRGGGERRLLVGHGGAVVGLDELLLLGEQLLLRRRGPDLQHALDRGAAGAPPVPRAHRVPARRCGAAVPCRPRPTTATRRRACNPPRGATDRTSRSPRRRRGTGSHRTPATASSRRARPPRRSGPARPRRASPTRAAAPLPR